jgi:two-component system NtrC family sensor kinase
MDESRVTESLLGPGTNMTWAVASDVFESMEMDEGICVVDAQGRLVAVNAAAASLLGWTEEELRGRGAQEFARCEDQDEAGQLRPGCPVARVLRGEATVRVTGDSFTRQDGTLLKVVYSASPLRRDGAQPGALIVFRPCEPTDSPQPA